MRLVKGATVYTLVKSSRQLNKIHKNISFSTNKKYHFSSILLIPPY